MNWAILEYETGSHVVIPNSLCRLGVPCVIPMIEEFQKQAKRKIRRPALPKLLFLPASEETIRIVLDKVRHAEKVWRDHRGNLDSVPDQELQAFLDILDKREKKVKGGNKAINMGEMAQKDWKALYAHLYGPNEALKRFGGNHGSHD